MKRRARFHADPPDIVGSIISRVSVVPAFRPAFSPTPVGAAFIELCRDSRVTTLYV